MEINFNVIHFHYLDEEKTRFDFAIRLLAYLALKGYYYYWYSCQMLTSFGIFTFT